jgi:uncharacterized protein with NRDE domain
VCTVSWVREAGGYHLLCNRDEKLTRGAAFEPAIRECGGVRYIAPIDSDAGGTWISVNEFGLSLCLLNRHGAGASSVHRSRGLLVRELAASASTDQVLRRLARAELHRYAPFALVALERERSAALAEWDGTTLSVDRAADRHMPLASSSYDEPGVQRARRSELQRLAGPSRRIDAAVLERLHGSHYAGAGPYSTCMHRPEAETVSFSHITVTSAEIRFEYHPSSPCRALARAA